MRRARVLAAVLSLFGLAPEAWAAPILYGIDDLRDRLVVIDPSTGAVTTVGFLDDVPGEAFYLPLAHDPATHTLYTWTAADGLLRIDRATGATTPVNPGGSTGQWFQGLSFGADGRLYGRSFGAWEIDLATGAPTQLSSELGLMAGMDLSPDGRLFGVVASNYQLYRDIDPRSGSYGSSVVLVREGGAPLGLHLETIGFGPGGQLLGVGYTEATYRTYTYNFATGRVELDGQPPGLYGTALESGTTYAYYFDPSGEIYLVRDWYEGTDLGDLRPTNPTLIDTTPIDEGGAYMLFDIDPETGIATNFRDIRAASDDFYHIKGLAYVPEPAPVSLLLAGVIGLARRVRRG